MFYESGRKKKSSITDSELIVHCKWLHRLGSIKSAVLNETSYLYPFELSCPYWSPPHFWNPFEQILSWFVDLRHCNSAATKANEVISKTFCSMSLKQWYSFSLLMGRHVNMEKAIYRVRLNREHSFYQQLQRMPDFDDCACLCDCYGMPYAAECLSEVKVEKMLIEFPVMFSLTNLSHSCLWKKHNCLSIWKTKTSSVHPKFSRRPSVFVWLI